MTNYVHFASCACDEDRRIRHANAGRIWGVPEERCVCGNIAEKDGCCGDCLKILQERMKNYKRVK